MRLSPLARPLIAAALGAALLSPAWAQELVSVRNPNVNLRAAPNLQAEVLWKLAKGYPLRVLESKGSWLHVQDFEGDEGWIARSVTASTPHHIVKGTTVNLRGGPGTQHAVVGKVAYGDVLQTARRQGDWVQVRQPNGKGTAWIASSLLWGW